MKKFIFQLMITYIFYPNIFAFLAVQRCSKGSSFAIHNFFRTVTKKRQPSSKNFNVYITLLVLVCCLAFDNVFCKVKQTEKNRLDRTKKQKHKINFRRSHEK